MIFDLSKKVKTKMFTTYKSFQVRRIRIKDKLQGFSTLDPIVWEHCFKTIEDSIKKLNSFLTFFYYFKQLWNKPFDQSPLL